MGTKLEIELMKVPRNVEISIEIPPDFFRVEDTATKASRLRMTEADALHLRSKELLIYRLTAAILIGVVVLSFWIILNKGLSNDEGKLALALLTSIVTGLVGYVTGKSAK